MPGQAYLLFILLCTLVLHGKAQTLFNARGEQLWISDETIVTVNGNVTNEGMVDNNGQLSVTGDWLNNGDYHAGKGKLIFNGEALQKINHHGQSVSILQLEGTGEKLLASDMVILDHLTLNEGILTTTSSATSLTLEATAGVDGGNATSFIDGPVIYKGTGYRYFPVGKNGNFRPLELLDVQGVHPVLQVEMQEPNPVATPGETLESISRIRFWEVIPIEGTYDGSLVSLAVGSDEGFRDLTGVVVAGAEQKGEVFNNLGRSDFTGTVSEGTVTSVEVSAHPYLALGLTTEFSSSNQVLVPSAFAPEAPDPKNRMLKIFATNIGADGFVFKIFNRWGMMVYETTSLQEAVSQGWNGMNEKTNEPAPFGVYTYYLSARFDNDAPVEQTGTITLFR